MIRIIDKNAETGLGRLKIPVAVSLLALTLCACSSALPVSQDNQGTALEVAESGQEAENEANTAVTEPETQEPEEILPVTVEILGKEYDLSENYLDLSDMTPEDISEVTGIISEMPDLEEVNLISPEGESTLSLTAVSVLKDALPDVHFDYEFDLFDQHVSTNDTEVIFVKAEIGNEGEETIRQALTILDKCRCTAVVLYLRQNV